MISPCEFPYYRSGHGQCETRHPLVGSINMPTLLESRIKEKERIEDMDNEADSGRNPKTHGTRESKEAEKANGVGNGV